MSSEIIMIVFTPISIVLLGIYIHSRLKKKKVPAKRIYKLINDLEKKYIY